VPKQLLRVSISQLLVVQAAIAVVLSFVLAIRASHQRIERLHSPINVNGWSLSGLNLADGRHIKLAGIKSLPAQSVALTEATKRGVEIASDGRVFGLVRIHRWCGNDPIREHIARVDLALLLEFIGESEPLADPVKWDPIRPGGSFSSSGWDIGEFLGFGLWCEAVKAERLDYTRKAVSLASETSTSEPN
jgi:hypothetical protein